VAKLDRLSRDVAFISGLMAQRVAFIVAELGPVKQQCSAGHDAEASRGLAAIKSRHGYR